MTLTISRLCWLFQSTVRGFERLETDDKRDGHSSVIT